MEADLPARDWKGESSPENHECTQTRMRWSTYKNNLKGKQRRLTSDYVLDERFQTWSTCTRLVQF